MVDPSIAVVLAGWGLGWVLAAGAEPFRPDPRDDEAPMPSVSVVVPARDEEARLPRLLEALAHDAGGIELIVVDDASADGTAVIARDAGATVVPVDPPPGWTGKAWACQQGATAATGDVLVFLDADTEPEPSFVGALARRAARTGGLVSVQPRHRVARPYEHLSAFANVVAVLGAGTGPAPARRWWRRPMAFGPALAIGRAPYLAAGGHGAVRAEVAEDVALAAHLDARGCPVECWAGGGIAYRMYPEGLRVLVQGWTKNLAAGAGATAPLRAVAVAVWITGLLRAAPLVAGGPVGWALLALVVAQVAVLLRRVGSFGLLDAILYPVLLGGFVALFAVSLARRVGRRPVAWRGRRVPPRPPAGPGDLSDKIG
jgi:4,4'-diaponeurosporenoate glycosyltransferase